MRKYRRSHAFNKLLRDYLITFEDFKGSTSPGPYSDVFGCISALSNTKYAQHILRDDPKTKLADEMVDNLAKSSHASAKYAVLVGGIINQLTVGLHINDQEGSFKWNRDQKISYDLKNQSLSMRKPPQYTFGLKGNKLERHLDIHRTRGGSVESDPFLRDPLHFPFLLVHADVDGSFAAVEDQYAFPVWRLLGIQQALQKKLATKGFSTGPLVWTIAVCGTTARIGGGYIKCEDGKVSSVITNFWKSSDLGNYDDALKLVLMINYIAGWAGKYCRDVCDALQPEEDKGEA